MGSAIPIILDLIRSYHPACRLQRPVEGGIIAIAHFKNLVKPAYHMEWHGECGGWTGRVNLAVYKTE
jgi:hypothetical protein